MKRGTLILLSLILLVYSSSLLIVPRILSVENRTYIYTSSITYNNNGASVQNIDSDLLTYSIFMNTSWQKAYLEAVNSAYIQENDFDGNPVIVFNSTSLNTGENMTVSYSMRLEEKIRGPPEIDFASSGLLNDIPEKLREEYGRSEGSWIADDDLKSLANTIWASQGNTTNVLRIVSGIADWVGNNVKSLSHDIPYYPLETYSSLEGDCDDQANLLIVLCRILRIPAYLQAGSLRWSSSTETYWDGHITSNLKYVSYHAWAMVYIPPWGWLPFDMTLGWSSGNALSVVKSARVWSLDTMPMINVTKSDWAGIGRDQKAKVKTSSIYSKYDDALILQNRESFLYALLEWRFWSIIAAILGLSIIVWQRIRSDVSKT